MSRALDRLADGETDLSALAHDLGFADHAHLTRTIRATTGDTPTALRAALTAASGPMGSVFRAEDFQGVGEVGGVGAGEGYLAGVGGVGEGQGYRVQPLAGQT